MSFEATAWAMRQRAGGPGPKLVLLALSDHHNRTSGQCNPKIDTLAVEAEMSERSVRRHLIALRDLGLIEWVNTYRPDGSLSTNTYRLRMDMVSPPPGHSVPTPRSLCPHPPVTVTEQVEPGSRTRNLNQPPTGGAQAPAAVVEGTIVGSEDDTAGTLVAEWIDGCRKRPPGSVIGQVGKHIKALLADGFDPAEVRSGLALWASKGLHPSTLPSVVNEAVNAAPGARQSNRMGMGVLHDALARAQAIDAAGADVFDVLANSGTKPTNAPWETR